MNSASKSVTERQLTRRIARRFVLFIVLISSLVTLVTTGVQLLFDYRRDIDTINNNIELIRSSHLSSIINSVWVEDEAQIINQLNGLVRYADMERMSISVNGKVRWQAGKQDSRRVIRQRIPLMHHYRGKDVRIGDLTVIASIDSVINRLIDKAIVILVTNALKTFVVAGFIFLLFHYLVAKRLYRLADWARSFRLSGEMEPVALERPEHGRAADEFDTVVEALNILQSHVQVSYGELRDSHSQMEQLAMHSQKVLNLHLERTPLAAVTWDGDFACMEWNRSAERIFGFNREEVIGKHVLEQIVSPAARAGIRREFEDLLNGRGGSHIITENLTRSGKAILCEWFNTLIKSEQGEPVAVASLIQDITVQEQYKTELIDARDEADRANRSKSEFLSSMSHELRTPLNAILGFGQLLEMVVDDEMQKKNAAEIIKAGNHLLELINDILDLSRIESGKLELSIEDVYINTVVRECIDLITPLAETRGVSLVDEITNNGDCVVHADYTRCKQVLLNLLSNAIKYNSRNGTVTLSIEHAGESTLRLNVVDTGRGLSEEQQARLFTPFERLGGHEAIEGTGIGLVITKRLLDMMGGHIGVTSSPGSGSCFWIDLPAGVRHDSEQVQVEDAPARMVEPTRGNGKRILYIEDNPANLRLVEQIIERHTPYQVIAASEASSGLALAESQKPDLILMDINLPGMDGYEATQRLQANPATQHIPVLAVSANAMPSDLEKGYHVGFRDYLTKPLDVGQLLDVLARYLDQQ